MKFIDWLVLSVVVVMLVLWLIFAALSYAEDVVQSFDYAPLQPLGLLEPDDRGVPQFKLLLPDVTTETNQAQQPTIFFEPEPRDPLLAPLCAVGPRGEITCWPMDPLTKGLP